MAADHNERLEFLGRRGAESGRVGMLYDRPAGSDEGDLTRMRAHLVREDSLHRAGAATGPARGLRLSEGEARGGGAQRPSILADALEASSVPPFLDGGFAAAQRLVQRLFGEADRRQEPTTGQGRQDRTAGMVAGAPPCAARPTASWPPAGKAHAQTFEVECACPRWAWPSAARAVHAAPPSRTPPPHAGQPEGQRQARRPKLTRQMTADAPPLQDA
jgi:ribonuclease-3